MARSLRLLLGFALLFGCAERVAAQAPAPSSLHLLTTPPSAWLRGDLHCPPGAADCNPCAHDVEAQFAAILGATEAWSDGAWSFAWDGRYTPSGRTAGSLLDGPVHHVQGFVRTNSARFPLAGSHSGAGNGRGSVFVIGAGANGVPRLSTLTTTSDAHPSGVQVIGQYLAFQDDGRLGWLEIEHSDRRPRMLKLPRGDARRQGMRSAGGGLGIARLWTGSHLVLVTLPGSRAPGARFTRFWSLAGPLTTPSSVRYLGEWQYAQPTPWQADYRYSENLSVITECRTGALYTVHTSGSDGLRGSGTWLLSRVAWERGQPRLVPLRAHHQAQRSRVCHQRSAATAHVTQAGALELYCHERAAVDTGLFREGSLRYRVGRSRR